MQLLKKRTVKGNGIKYRNNLAEDKKLSDKFYGQKFGTRNKVNEIESTLNYITNHRVRTDGRLAQTYIHTGRKCFQQMPLAVHSV